MDKSNMTGKKNPFQNQIVEMTKQDSSINSSSLLSTADKVEEARLGPYSGNNGPQFYKKSETHIYEKLPVDYSYKIPSPSIEDARKMIAKELKQQQYKEENTEEQR